jgi:glucokinase
VTTTPTQSLSLLNNSFVLRMSDRLAARVRAEAGQAAAAQVERVAALVWQRAPTAAERPLLEEFVSAHGLAPLCRVLMGTNEFLFVQ